MIAMGYPLLLPSPVLQDTTTWPSTCPPAILAVQAVPLTWSLSGRADYTYYSSSYIFTCWLCSTTSSVYAYDWPATMPRSNQWKDKMGYDEANKQQHATQTAISIVYLCMLHMCWRCNHSTICVNHPGSCLQVSFLATATSNSDWNPCLSCRGWNIIFCTKTSTSLLGT